jgi:hypothetical protein
MSKPPYTVRKLSNGDHVVDCGHQWFRVPKDAKGQVTAVDLICGGDGVLRPERRPATKREAAFARRLITEAGGRDE